MKTVFQSDQPKTGKTDKTDVVSNNEFLRVVFSGETNGSRPVVVSFRGNPGAVCAKDWSGKPWSGDDLPVDANNYFSLGTFRPDESGKYRRIKSRFHALHAVMLDDVGSKVPRERLTLPPSWLLETSKQTISLSSLTTTESRTPAKLTR